MTWDDSPGLEGKGEGRSRAESSAARGGPELRRRRVIPGLSGASSATAHRRPAVPGEVEEAESRQDAAHAPRTLPPAPQKSSLGAPRSRVSRRLEPRRPAPAWAHPAAARGPGERWGALGRPPAHSPHSDRCPAGRQPAACATPSGSHDARGPPIASRLRRRRAAAARGAGWRRAPPSHCSGSALAVEAQRPVACRTGSKRLLEHLPQPESIPPPAPPPLASAGCSG